MNADSVSHILILSSLAFCHGWHQPCKPFFWAFEELCICQTRDQRKQHWWERWSFYRVKGGDWRKARRGKKRTPDFILPCSAEARVGVRVGEKKSGLVGKQLREAEHVWFFQCQGTLVFLALIMSVTVLAKHNCSFSLSEEKTDVISSSITPPLQVCCGRTFEFPQIWLCPASEARPAVLDMPNSLSSPLGNPTGLVVPYWMELKLGLLAKHGLCKMFDQIPNNGDFGGMTHLNLTLDHWWIWILAAGPLEDHMPAKGAVIRKLQRLRLQDSVTDLQSWINSRVLVWYVLWISSICRMN